MTIWLKANLVYIIIAIMCIVAGALAASLYGNYLKAQDDVTAHIMALGRELRACQQAREAVNPVSPVPPPGDFQAQQAYQEAQALDWTDLGILETYFDDDCILPEDFAAYSDHMIIVVCTDDERVKDKFVEIERWLRDSPHRWRFYLPFAGQLLWLPVLFKRG